MKVVATVDLPSGEKSAAKHTVQGSDIGPAHRLRIVQFEGESEFYLIRYDHTDSELTDTLHESLAAAREQANYEYGVTQEQWRFSAAT
jgi:hypothetical protein